MVVDTPVTRRPGSDCYDSQVTSILKDHVYQMKIQVGAHLVKKKHNHPIIKPAKSAYYLSPLSIWGTMNQRKELNPVPHVSDKN